MMIHFQHKDWPKSRISVIIDNRTKVCTAANSSIDYVKGWTLARILDWGYRRAEKMEIQFQKSAPQSVQEMKEFLYPTDVLKKAHEARCCTNVEACQLADRCLLHEGPASKIKSFS